MQSGNLYAYGINNPLMYQDPGGEFVITVTALCIIGGAALVGTIGGFVGNYIANQRGATGWEKAGWIAGGVVVGGAAGAVGGYALAPVVASAAGASTVTVGSATFATSKFIENSQNLFNNTAKHIFSDDHVRDGIMKLGNSQADIFNKLLNVTNQYSTKFVSGSNEIRTVINGAQTTIRFYVENGKIININAFVGYSERVVGTLLK